MSESIRRVADAARSEKEREELEKQLAKASQLFPRAIYLKFRRAFTKRGLPFFDFYIKLKRISLGEAPPEDLKQQFRKVLNMLVRIKSPVDNRPLSPQMVNMISEARSDLNTYLNRIAQGTAQNATWLKVNQILVPLISEVARDKGIYMKSLQRGAERWATFRKMTPKQEKIERLRDDDPETYDLVLQRGETLAQIDAGIKKSVAAGGMTSRRALIMGRPVTIGTDPITGEERVFDRDGDVIPVEDYITKRREQAEWREKSYRAPAKMEVPLKSLRILDDADIEALSGEVEYDAITDDKAKQSRLTRIFATKRKPVMISQADGTIRVEHLKVIVSGRFKGIYLDDMINSQGRMIEGTAYTLEPLSGREGKIPVRRDVSQREPYVTHATVPTVYTDADTGKKYTVKEEKLHIKIPGTNEFKEIRHMLKKLACNTGAVTGCVPSISYHPVKGSRAASFYFSPKDYKAVRDAVQGMSLSKGAMKFLKTYFNDLARAEQATAKENLKFYSAKSIGGFKKTRKYGEEIKDFDLLTKQKQALAWMDAKGNNGVCALDTGVGKTLTGIAMMQKLLRDGLGEEDATYETPTGKTIKTNGRFLIVTPKDLKGNFPKEVRDFLSDPSDLLQRMDVISYREFGRAVSGKVPTSLKNKAFWKQRASLPKSRLAAGKVWDIQLYTALFFDEAQKLTLTKTGKVTSPSKPTQAFAAADIYHPRKIFLTASPMEKEPEQAYLLQSLAANEPISGRSPDAVENRKRMKRFMERFTNRVGGRIVSAKKDPALKSEMQKWVKQAVFFADKTKVEEFNLPQKQEETITVTMNPAVEQVYRATTQTFAKSMKALAIKLREREDASGAARDSEADKKFFGAKLKPILKLLNGLSNYPAETMQDLAIMAQSGYMPDKLTPEGLPAPISPEIQKVLRKLPFKAEELMSIAQELQEEGNPKLEVARDYLMTEMKKCEKDVSAKRTLVFTDDKKLCQLAAKYFAARIPGTHVVATNTSISILEGSGSVDHVKFKMEKEDVLRIFGGDSEKAMQAMQEAGNESRIEAPFSKRAYRKHPELPAHRRYNTHYKADQWQQFVFKEVISPNPSFRCCILLGTEYQFGHNLQEFDQVIHLDRNSWNSENMKQRTARSWRQGQKKPVTVRTVDTVYAERPDNSELDRTLDEIRRWFQEMEGDLFDEIIKEAQDVELGKEWLDMQQRSASFMRVDQDVLELMASPYVSRSKVKS